MIADIHPARRTGQLHLLTENGGGEHHVAHFTVAVDDGITDDAAGNDATGGNGDMGPDNAVPDNDTGFDVHRRNNEGVAHLTGHVVDIFQEQAVGLQESLRLAAVQPGVDLGRPETAAVADHTHEDGGEIVFPLHRFPGGNGLPEGGHEALRILQVVEPHLGQFGDGGFGLFHHVDDVVALEHIDAEALVVFHFLGVDEPVAVGTEGRNGQEVRDENGVVEHHQQVIPRGNARRRQGDGVGRPLALLLDQVGTGQVGILFRHEGTDLLAVFVGNEQVFVRRQGQQPIDDMLQDRLAGHMDQRLGLGMGVGPQTGTLAGHGENNFHDTLHV